MTKEYFVLHKRDFSGETLSLNKKQRELYDAIKQFSKLGDAKEFALEIMHEMPILAKFGNSLNETEKIRNSASPYVVAAYFANKYQHYCYDGSSDSVPTHEVTRCSEAQLENTLYELAKEKPNKIYWGIELKLVG